MGSDRRLYAAIKFFLYTLVGSVIMLLGILALYFKAGAARLTSPPLLASASQFDTHWQVLLFWAFFFASRSRCRLFPFHTLAARCAYGSAHGRLRHPGWSFAEDGHVRVHSLFAAADCRGSGGAPPDCDDHAGRFDNRHFIRRAGVHDAEGHEEADRLQFGQPPGILQRSAFLP